MSNRRSILFARAGAVFVLASATAVAQGTEPLGALAQRSPLPILSDSAGQGAPAGQQPDACTTRYVPKVSQPGKDVIWLPTSEALVERMLSAADVKSSDVVYDLGAGDGRIVIAAAQRFGAKAVGVEYNPQLVELARCRIAAAGLAGRARIIQGDLFKTPLDGASVITLYLLPDLDLRLRPKLLALKPGTRIVSNSYRMGDWQPDERIDSENGIAWLWVVPAHVDGTWTFKSSRGHDGFKITFVQTYQRVEGLVDDGAAITNASLSGAHLIFEFPQNGTVTRVSAVVSGARIEAKVTRNGHTADYVGVR